MKRVLLHLITVCLIFLEWGLTYLIVFQGSSGAGRLLGAFYIVTILLGMFLTFIYLLLPAMSPKTKQDVIKKNIKENINEWPRAIRYPLYVIDLVVFSALIWTNHLWLAILCMGTIVVQAGTRITVKVIREKVKKELEVIGWSPKPE